MTRAPCLIAALCVGSMLVACDDERHCDSDDVPAYESLADCELNSGWPCACSNTGHCDNGVDCIGRRQEKSGWLGHCSHACPGDEETGCPTSGYFDLGVAEICNTHLDADGCMCLLSGCVGTFCQDDEEVCCPIGYVCIAPSCIALEPGCPGGVGEEKVCYPFNW
jgi:hypothetical protein